LGVGQGWQEGGGAIARTRGGGGDYRISYIVGVLKAVLLTFCRQQHPVRGRPWAEGTLRGGVRKARGPQQLQRELLGARARRVHRHGQVGRRPHSRLAFQGRRLEPSPRPATNLHARPGAREQACKQRRQGGGRHRTHELIETRISIRHRRPSAASFAPALDPTPWTVARVARVGRGEGRGGAALRARVPA
jgi:hypothetical protein